MREAAPKELDRLREEIWARNVAARKISFAVLPLGVEEIDRRFYPAAACGSPGCMSSTAWREWDDGAVTGFLLALSSRLLAQRQGTLLWISLADDPMPRQRRWRGLAKPPAPSGPDARKTCSGFGAGTSVWWISGRGRRSGRH